MVICSIFCFWLMKSRGVSGMDMISFGPDIRGPHAPGEKVHVGTVERFWRLLLAVLEDLTLRAFDDQCTHAEAALENVEIDGEEIDCPLHGAKFSVKSGQALTLPAVKPIRTHEIKVEGETLFVKLNEQRLIEE